MNPLRGGWLIGSTLLAAATLSVAHLPGALPDWVAWLRPDWVVLVMFFWLIERPHRVGMLASWVFGLLLDVLHGDPLGLNGLGLAVMALLGWAWYERLRMQGGAQQAMVLFVIALVIGAVRDGVAYWAQDAPLSPGVAVSPAVTALLWPVAVVLLSRLARQVK